MSCRSIAHSAGVYYLQLPVLNKVFLPSLLPYLVIIVHTMSCGYPHINYLVLPAPPSPTNISLVRLHFTEPI